MVKINKNSKKNYFSIAWKELAVIAAVIFLDLLSKFLVSKTMMLGEKKVFIKKFFSFYYTLNTEAAMGFDFWLGDKLGAAGLRIFFIALVSVATIIFGVFLVLGHKGSIWYRVPLALIIGGAIGNLYDRVVHHAVRDFIHFEYFGKELFGRTYFPTFNLADSALVIGVFLFVFYVIFIDPKYQKRKAAQRAEAEAMTREAQQNVDNSDKSKDDDGDKREEIGTARGGARPIDNAQFYEGNPVADKAKQDKIAVKTTDTTANRNADKTTADKTLTDKTVTDITDFDSEGGSIIESDAHVVEVLSGKRNYSKKIVTETIITETIITETKGAPTNDKNKNKDKN